MTPERWEKVGRIFDAATALRPEDRSSFLDHACRDDESLRREVESLLHVEDKAGDFLDSPAMEDAARLLAKEEPRFSAGTKLGSYEVLEFLESGGMGEVYKARHVSLKNLVALKFLPLSVAQDVERLRRFKQEARAASALNHPNIVTVHDFVETEQGNFIVTEYVEGETLRQRLRRGRMDLNEAVDVATQVATALAAAHAVGVIHRDIKPENVMIRPDAYVKVLDFGLAKLGERADKDLATAARLETGTGVVMGTSRYMSPEQARGLAVDARTDAWSLGVLLYEMLSGRAPFEGETNSDVLASILEREPAPLEHSGARVSRQLEGIVGKSLRKDRDERYQTISALLTDLKNAKSERTARSGFTPRRLSLLAGTLVLVIGGSLWFYATRHAANSSLLPMKVVPLTSFPGTEGCPAFSPDGNQIAFDGVGDKGDNSDIYLMLIGSEKPLQLTTDPGWDYCPTWSPDGRQIAFLRTSQNEQAIYSVPALGGPERKLLSLGNYNSRWGPALDWSPDGKYIVGVEKHSMQPPNLFLFSPETGEKRILTSPAAANLGDFFPAFSPDSQTVAFVRSNTVLSQDIYLVPVAGGEPKRLTFDNGLVLRPAWTTDGREIIFPSTRAGGDYGLWRISVRGGTSDRLPVGGHYVPWLAISPQKNRLAYVQWQGEPNLYRIDITGSGRPNTPPTRLTSSTRLDSAPQYSPDGKRIVYQSDRSGSNEIWMCDSDGAIHKQLTFLKQLAGTPRWSPDGKRIAFDFYPEGKGKADIYIVSPDGGPPRPVVTEDSDDNVPSWSADGKWIYFSSNRTGDYEVWKVHAEGGEAKQVTRKGGGLPFESPDAKYVYFVKTFNSAHSAPGVWRVPVDGGEELQVLDSFDPVNFGDWAVVSDGLYFIKEDQKEGAVIEFFDFATHKIEHAALLGNVDIFEHGIAVSPDRRYILYTQNDNPGGDIMLVENFR